MADTFTTAQIGFKTNFSDNLSGAITFNNNPFGVDIDYAAFAGTTITIPSLNLLKANLKGQAITAVGKYQISDRMSGFAGLKYSKVNGAANLTVLGAGNYSLSTESDTTFILGAAYEIPDIALRVSATYESAAQFLPTVTNVGGMDETTPGEINIAESLLLEFQSGIAKDTLLFGSIRHAKWSDSQVYIATGGTPLTTFDDSTTYSIGVGRKFSDALSGSVTFTHAPSECTDVGLLSPTCENNTLSVGGKYSMDNGVSIAGGVSFRKYKTATGAATQGSIVFSGSTLTTVGLKLSKTF